MNTNIISKYLQLLRKKHNYTQDELAKRLDISRQAVSKWETGAAIPDLEVLLKISKLYGITINDILEPNIPTKKITDFEQLSEVPENELREKQEIKTDFGQTLYWDYYLYVKENPITNWNKKTYILYGNRDNMQDENMIKNFSKNFSCKLSILEDGEHYFHTEKLRDYYKNWLRKTIK